MLLPRCANGTTNSDLSENVLSKGCPERAAFFYAESSVKKDFTAELSDHFGIKLRSEVPLSA